MICGDFNFDMHKPLKCKRLKLVYDLFNELDLHCCDDLDVNKVAYTYHHDTLALYSLVDHVFIQKQSVESISAYAVLPDGDNCSDYYAVTITLQSKMTVDSNDADRNVHRDNDDAPIMWSVGDTLAYSNMCQEGLDKLDFPKCYNCVYPC